MESKRIKLKKMLLIILKYLPIFLSLIFLIQWALLTFLGLNLMFAMGGACIAIVLLLLSKSLDYCIYHRLFLFHRIIGEVLYYFDITFCDYSFIFLLITFILILIPYLIKRLATFVAKRFLFI